LSYDATFKLTKYLVYTSKDGYEFKGKLINLRLVNNYCGVEIISGLLSRAHCLGEKIHSGIIFSLGFYQLKNMKCIKIE